MANLIDPAEVGLVVGLLIDFIRVRTGLGEFCNLKLSVERQAIGPGYIGAEPFIFGRPCQSTDEVALDVDGEGSLIGAPAGLCAAGARM